MRMLDRKLVRNLWSLRSQALAIAMVIASGITAFVLSLTTMDALRLTQQRYYGETGFAEVFCSLERAPEILKGRLEAIPGVQRVTTRVLAPVNLDVPGFADPASGLLVSQSEPARGELNRFHLLSGRAAEPDREDEVVVSGSFAAAHGFVPGSRLGAIVNGRRESLTVVGTATSPEFLYPIKPGDVFPDPERYGILWMGRKALATAQDMDGAFNDVVLTLADGADEGDVLQRVDAVLDRYGSLGAYARADQFSHRYLSEEFKQLASMATFFPLIFLGVASFLLGIVVDRLVGTQREQLAALKAFGYGDGAVAWHYVKLVLAIVLLGTLLGIGLGAWLGRALADLYCDFFEFPYIEYRLRPTTALAGFAISAAAALLGTLRAVRRAARLPPAEAMRPLPPSRYRRTLLERLGLGRLVSEPSRMILRHLERRPLKALLSVVGISMSVAIVMLGRFHEDAVDLLLGVQFGLVQRDDVAVTFTDARPRRALHELRALPGVACAEPFRQVAARLRHGHRTHRVGILGLPPEGELRRIIDDRYRARPLPRGGIVLTDFLADLLRVGPGDALEVEVLEGTRPRREVAVVGLVSEFVGVSGYMALDALNALMHEGPVISGAHLAVDEPQRSRLYDALKETPRVAGVTVRQASIDALFDTMGRTVLIFAFVNTLLAGSVAFGVVYNAARISLSERSRELASLRVMGFTRGEISWILNGELVVLTLLALPLGLVIGQLLCEAMMQGLRSELYRIPAVITHHTRALAVTVVVASAAISAWRVQRRLAHLDLLGVLKTKD